MALTLIDTQAILQHFLMTSHNCVWAREFSTHWEHSTDMQTCFPQYGIMRWLFTSPTILFRTHFFWCFVNENWKFQSDLSFTSNQFVCHVLQNSSSISIHDWHQNWNTHNVKCFFLLDTHELLRLNLVIVQMTTDKRFFWIFYFLLSIRKQANNTNKHTTIFIKF